MPRLRLQEADRQRLGTPELLPVDLTTITNREAIALQKQGFPTPKALARALQTSDESDQHYEAWTAFVALALRRAGIEVDVATLEFMLPVEVLANEELPEPVVVQGKAEEAQEASTNSPTTT
jgi:hypothetical protein